MLNILYILMGLTLLTVMGTLLAGLLVMAKGGTEKTDKLSNKLMTLRVVSQGFAVIIFVLILAVSQS